MSEALELLSELMAAFGRPCLSLYCWRLRRVRLCRLFVRFHDREKKSDAHSLFFFSAPFEEEIVHRFLFSCSGE